MVAASIGYQCAAGSSDVSVGPDHCLFVRGKSVKRNQQGCWGEFGCLTAIIESDIFTGARTSFFGI